MVSRSSGNRGIKKGGIKSGTIVVLEFFLNFNKDGILLDIKHANLNVNLVQRSLYKTEMIK